ncbi:MAG: PAS domain-containing protein, partial [Nitrospirales bacterium]
MSPARQHLKQESPDIQKTLKHLEQHHALILQAAGEGIFGLDLEGRHTFVNPAAANMLGYDQKELIGKNSHALWHHTKPNG